MEGTIVNIKEYGVFVDLGGINGLIHVSKLYISESSWKKLSDISSIIKLGQKVTVEILDVDIKKSRISLGLHLDKLQQLDIPKE